MNKNGVWRPFIKGKEVGGSQYCIQIAGFDGVLIERFNIQGGKDGIHLNYGRNFVIRDGKLCTYDDGIALNAGDWPSCTPMMGSLEDGVIENVEDMPGGSCNFARVISGAWSDWRKGIKLQRGDMVRVGQNVYCVHPMSFEVNPDGTVGEHESNYAPSHSEGVWKSPDGINFLFMHSDGNLRADIRRVVFRNIKLNARRGFNPGWEINKWARMVHPDLPQDEWPVIDIRLENVEAVTEWPVVDGFAHAKVYMKNVRSKGPLYQERFRDDKNSVIRKGMYYKTNVELTVEDCEFSDKVRSGLDFRFTDAKGSVRIDMRNNRIKRPLRMEVATADFRMTGDGQSALTGTLSLIPKPQIMKLTGGITTNNTVSYQNDASIPKEGYRLDVSTNGIVITSSTVVGRFYAERTLAQFPSRQRPCCLVEDAPKYGWRGFLLDEGRHFFGKGEVKRLIDLMSDYKMNVFHWHLTEDQGWRLAIDRYPRLAEISSARRSSPPPGEETGCDNERYGPFFYTKEEVREIVAYARDRHVTVVPEIDFPGHSQAVLAAYPNLSCRGVPVETGTQWGISDEILCAGNDDTIDFLKNVIDEVCEMFDSPVIHIGGDECPYVRWKSCHKCQTRIKTLGLNGEAALQGWLFREIAAHLKRKGRRACGWDSKFSQDKSGERRTPEEMYPRDAIVQSWRDVESGRDLVMDGYEIVASPSRQTYYTLPIGLGALDPFPYRQWTRTEKPLGLETCYRFSPLQSIPNGYERFVLGGEVCAWTESTHNRAELEWKIFPRMFAHAEALWADPMPRRFDEFAVRAELHRKRILARGVNCSPLGIAKKKGMTNE